MESPGHTDTRKSRIPPPRPTATSCLQEMTESQHNSRTQSSSLRIPAPSGIKRAAPESQSQPGAKRPTLPDCAGEHNVKRSLPNIGSAVFNAPSTSLKGKSIASLAPKSLKHTKSFAGTFSTPAQPTRMARRLQGAIPRPATTQDQYNMDNIQHGRSNGEKSQNVLDVDERLREVESQFYGLKDVMSQTLAERKSQEQVIELAQTRASDLQRQRDKLEAKNLALQTDLESMRLQLQSSTVTIERERTERKYQLEDQTRQHQRELNDLRRESSASLEKLRRTYHDELEDVKKKHRAEMEDQAKRTAQAVEDIRTELRLEQQGLRLEIQEKDENLRKSREALNELQLDLDREKSMKGVLRGQMAEAELAREEMEGRTRALQAQVDFLKSDSKQQSDQFFEMEARMQQALRLADEARQKLVKEETERRILFNKYQELKGNIRVMCRVRPMEEKGETGEANITFPDAKSSSSQVAVAGPEERNSLGVISRKTIPFEFDRVFGPDVQNDEVFNEISQLVQSALDGYNVCIFCYGQTGSGKTYTMSSQDGMIPRATHMIYGRVGRLKEASWNYTMEGSFIEVYNEELHDLLGGPTGAAGIKDADGRKRLEIRHDDIRKSTTVVNCKTVQLDSAEKVESMLQMAQKNRSVAATKANERSSRSHSVFILKLVGENTATGERCEGTLNLVDLAGSERLKQSGAEGDRMKETQSINKSLACLGDVIEALSRGAPHVPYRNSKLTHMLQYSLGGNSKTLMFVMVSPMQAHLKETITSLRFATKVHNTHIGTARPTKKIKDRVKDV